MNTKKLPALVLTILIAGVLSAPALALPQKKKPRKITTAPSEKPLRDEFTELLLRTQKAAEQAQVEARLAREKNEELQKQLAQNTQELAQLRQAITNLGGQLAEIKLPKTHEASSTNSPAPSPSEPPPNRRGAEHDNGPDDHDEQPSADEPHARVQDRVEEPPTEHRDTLPTSDHSALDGSRVRGGDCIDK